jgi:hypothetical protein
MSRGVALACDALTPPRKTVEAAEAEIADASRRVRRAGHDRARDAHAVGDELGERAIEAVLYASGCNVSTVGSCAAAAGMRADAHAM